MRSMRLGSLMVTMACAAVPVIAGGQAIPSGQSTAAYKRPSDAELKLKLTPLQFAVTRRDFTETPYKDQYWNNHQAGIYVDVISGAPLFSSIGKYDSPTGRPRGFSTSRKGRTTHPYSQSSMTYLEPRS